MRKTTVNYCIICQSIVEPGKMMCDICETTYPCFTCTNKVKNVCLCKRWKKWFHLQWQQFCTAPEKTEKNPSDGNREAE